MTRDRDKTEKSRHGIFATQWYPVPMPIRWASWPSETNNFTPLAMPMQQILVDGSQS